MTSAFAIDPGGTSGFAEYIDGAHTAWHRTYDESYGCIHAVIESHRPDLVICESYTIFAGSAKKSQDGIKSLKLWGWVDGLCRWYDVEFISQSPSDAKMFSTDEKLKKYGWWTVGSDHPRDASRHLMLALATRRVIDLKQLLV